MSDRALRSEYEALQAREKRARDVLSGSTPAVQEEVDHLSREVESLEKALEAREAGATRRLNRRPVSQRVAAFGFQVLFVAPMVAMVGVGLGRQLRYQREAAWLLLVGGLLLTLAWMVGPLRTAVLRGASAPWRLARRARRALAVVEASLPR
ncbi:MAG: hypothetical protein AMXMBFR34_02960 [Myxococcaceae bacterium]